MGFEPTTPGLKVREPFGPHSTLAAESAGEGQSALCEDESCGLARVTSDDRIVRAVTRCGKPRDLPKPVPPSCPDAPRQQQNAPG